MNIIDWNSKKNNYKRKMLFLKSHDEPIPDYLVDEAIILGIAQYKCFYCLKWFASRKTLDHFIPRSKGGKDDDTNLVDSCWTCNMFKANIVLSEDFKYFKESCDPR